MKTEMKDTSLDSFSEVRNTIIEGRRLQVYNVISRMGECSNSQIANELRLSINKITGRVNELRNYFKVVGYSKKDICPITGRLVLFWKVVRDIDEFRNIESSISPRLSSFEVEYE